jgi:MFS family permease
MGKRNPHHRLASWALPHRRSLWSTLRSSGPPHPKVPHFSLRTFFLILSIAGIIVTGIIQVNNIYLLMVMRVIQGIIVGAYMAFVPLYINEVTPYDLRGTEAMLSMIGIVLGVVLDYAFKVIFVKTNANYELFWRFIFTFTAVPCIIQVIAILTGFMPESPMSLIQKGKIE